MSTLNRLPSLIHAAFNPIIVEVEDATLDTISISMLADKAYILEKETFNDKAIFDLSPIVRLLFNDTITNGSQNWFIDNNLVVKYTAKILETTYYFTALNAVRQIKESLDLLPSRGTFLTQFERLKFYEDYATQISVLSDETGLYFSFDSGTQEYVSLSNSTFCFQLKEADYASISNAINDNVYLTTEDNEVITNEAGEEIVIITGGGTIIERRMPIDTCCIPENPFYVRWINQLGGWDYWMFSRKQLLTNAISDSVTFTPYQDDTSIIDSTNKQLALTAKQSILVGAEQLTNNEFDVISKIIYSPKIQLYNKDTFDWTGLLVEDTKTEKETSLSKQSIELTFVLPTPQIQL